MLARRKVAAMFATAGVTLGFMSPAALAQQQRGLVNVNVGDVTVLENVAIGVAAQAVANVCPNLNVGQVAVLAVQAARQDVEQQTNCEGEINGQQGPIAIAG